MSPGVVYERQSSGGSDADQATTPGSPLKASWLIAAMLASDMCPSSEFLGQMAA
jgi:hypothetical protein